MTANELADFVEISKPDDKTHQAIATMLRQQEAALLVEQKHNEMLMAEIEALKKELALQRLSDISQEIKNEPVAWMFEKDGAYMCLKHMNGVRFDGGIPLYTHPMRELTDEEIGEFIHQMVLCCQVHPNSADINVLGLAQIVEDILKKASEK
jgi:hypothetical protein